MDTVIRLTRLNNQPLAINSDLIKFVESAPDSVITLIGGEKILVKESVNHIIDEVVNFRRSLLAGLPLLTAESRITLPAPVAPPQAIASPAGESAERESGKRNPTQEGHRG
jgi:flagellar protein FlbD